MHFTKKNIYFQNMNYPGLNPLHFGYASCRGTQSFGPVVRTNWVIHFVVSGFGYYYIDNKNYKVSPGEMFVIPPNVVTLYKADNEKPWSYIWIGFSCDTSLPAMLDNVIRFPEAMNVFESMKECEKFEKGRSAFLAARLWDLFSLILGKEENKPDFIKRALDLIHSEYMNKITVGSIANELNLDRSYFSTIFKNHTGVSPMNYIINHRMNIAARLMVNEGINVSTAAYSVGYTDVFTFSKMFKIHYGVSPTEYVKNNKLHLYNAN